jgi:hypothetical protein
LLPGKTGIFNTESTECTEERVGSEKGTPREGVDWVVEAIVKRIIGIVAG